MSLHRRAVAAHTAFFIWWLVNISFSNGIQSDVDCLRFLKDSLEDPLNSLASTWKFDNTTEGFICEFTGVDCYHPHENKVMNIHLSDMGLKGEFPRALNLCSNLTDLDLSRNNISGNIPSDISKLIRNVVTLDLSSNDLSGHIPVDLAHCSFLNIIKLGNNRLTGQIPLEFSLLDRVSGFSVRDNQLTGQVPNFKHVTATDYSNNPGLCGNPFLPVCKVTKKPADPGIISAVAACGIAAGALVVLGLLFCIRG